MKKHVLYSLAVVGAAAFGMAGFGAGDVSAASVTIPSGGYPGTSAGIQAAVNQATSGDTITISAGTYSLADYININAKSGITLQGDGDVTLTYDGQTASTADMRQAIRVLDSNDITLKDIKVQAANPTNEATFATASSGIGVNSSCDINLTGLTVTGFGGAGGILVTKLADGGTHSCSAENITFDNLTVTNNNIGIFFTDGATTPPNTVITGIEFTGTNTFVAGSYDQNFAIGSYSTSGGTQGVRVYGPEGERLNVGVFKGEGYPTHQWLAVMGQVAWVLPGSTIDGVPVEEIERGTLGFNYCLELLNETPPVEECPDGKIPDENGNCECPPEEVMDEEGNCVCPPDQERDENGNCVPILPTIPNTGAGLIQDVMKSGAVWMIGIGGGLVVGGALFTKWAKKYNRIKL